jgi:2-keto-4-pentenoate hydratase/2-oxohepta-3-ene-1,7-dioic acid hydratase in catechol pathway
MMRIARFLDAGGTVRVGLVEGDRVRLATGNLFAGLTATAVSLPLAEVRLLAPIDPVNILAIGRNYKAHAEEWGGGLPRAPVMFMKATTSVTGPDAEVVLPAIAPRAVDFEAELAVVIGRTARGVDRAEALDYVLGYTCANDISARDCQRGDEQWCRGKSFDTFCPLGPWIETELDPAACAIRGRVDGEVYQDASTSLLVFDVPYLISYLSAGMTLLPGTVILTGTPGGVGSARQPPRYLKAGAVTEVEIAGIGLLRNRIVAAAATA